MRWHQVDLLAGAVTVTKSKTNSGEGCVVPLSQTAWQVL